MGQQWAPWIYLWLCLTKVLNEKIDFQSGQFTGYHKPIGEELLSHIPTEIISYRISTTGLSI